jgi:hypothetical protein
VRRSLTVRAAVVVALAALAGCSGDTADDRPDRSPTTDPAANVPTTAAPPSTVDEATFDQRVAAIEGAISANATDPCRLFTEVFPRFQSDLPPPGSPRQFAEGSRTLVAFLSALADAPVPGGETAGARLRDAAQQAVTQAAASGWEVVTGPDGAFGSPEFAEALSTYAAAAQDACIPPAA